MKKFGLYLYSFLIVISFSSACQANDELINMVYDKITSIVKKDTYLEFRQFDSKIRVSERYEYISHPGADVSFEAQMPKKILQSPDAWIRVLPLQGCAVDFEEYGLVPIDFFNYSQTIALVDRARIKQAFAVEGINQELTLEEVENIREFGNEKYTGTSIKSLLDFNVYLLKQYERGEIEDLFQILDNSEGCGAGELFVTIENFDDFQSIHYIPDFYFRICEKRLTNPWDVSACVFWDRAFDKVIMVSGIYRWQTRNFSKKDNTGTFHVTSEEVTEIKLQ